MHRVNHGRDRRGARNQLHIEQSVDDLQPNARSRNVARIRGLEALPKNRDDSVELPTSELNSVS